MQGDDIMEKEKIEELYDIHTSEPNAMNLNDFAYAINQAELEWYKKLEKKLESIIYKSDLDYYHSEIQNKIKELENEN